MLVNDLDPSIKRGFTLVEVIIALWLIVALMWLLATNLQSVVVNSKKRIAITCSNELVDVLQNVKQEYRQIKNPTSFFYENHSSRIELKTKGCSEIFGEIDKSLEQTYLTSRSYDWNILLLIESNEWLKMSNDRRKLVSTFYPDSNLSIFDETPKDEIPKEDEKPIDLSWFFIVLKNIFLFIIIPLVSIIWFIYFLAFLDKYLTLNQLRYPRLVNLFLNYKLGRKYLWVGDWVDIEIYTTFQQILRNYDFIIKKSYKSSWIIELNQKVVIKVRNVERDLQKVLSNTIKEIDENSIIWYEIEVTWLEEEEIPMYLKGMITEKFLSSLQFKIKMEEIDEKTNTINAEKEALLNEVTKKRNFVNQLKGLSDTVRTEFNWLFSTVTDLEKIEREYKSLSKKMLEIKNRKV